ncbi:MAG: hypothetical protein P8Z80_14545 [Pseudolabrys sp.]
MRCAPAHVRPFLAFAAGFMMALAALLAPPAHAQSTHKDSLFSTAPSGDFAPGSGLRGNMFSPGDVLAPSQTPLTMPSTGEAMPTVPAGKVALSLSARFGKKAPAIKGGLVWRVFDAKPDADGKFKLVKQDKEASPVLVLPAGAYIVLVDFGLATAVRPVTLRSETVHEVFDLPAGALRMQGQVGDVKILASQISFDVFHGSQFEANGGDKRPIAQHVLTGQLVVVPEGVYHIVSHYGDANAVVRSDIRVQAGKLTDITINHRAAAITLKLVTQKGGEALANTAWSVLTPGGDVIKESIGAFPRVILSAGEYRAIARNEGKIYERDFQVTAGVDGDVEVLAK